MSTKHIEKIKALWMILTLHNQKIERRKRRNKNPKEIYKIYCIYK